MNNFKFSIQNPVNLLNKFYNRHLLKRVMYRHLYLLVILAILVQTMSCEQGPGPSICSGQEYDPDEYACIRGELVPLDDSLPSSSAGIWDGTANTDWYSNSETEFTITTAEQLAGFAKLVNEGNFFEDKTVKLGGNIALNDTANWRNWGSSKPSNEWESIGGVAIDDNISIFAGTFDGSGFVVSGVYINSAENYTGFFGFIFSGAIKNLGVVASYVKGNSYAGGLLGYGLGDGNLVNNSYYRGTVTGGGRNFDAVGGLVGALAGIDEGSSISVSNSYYSGVVTGNGLIVGGLVGAILRGNGIVSNSYSAGAVTGIYAASGLVGGSEGDNNGIKNSYSSCVVTTTFINDNDYLVVEGDLTSGLVAAGDNWSITSSYYNKEVNTPSDEWGGEGKTILEMKQKATYAGWDFNGIWGIGGDINGGYPYLLGTQQQ